MIKTAAHHAKRRDELYDLLLVSERYDGEEEMEKEARVRDWLLSGAMLLSPAAGHAAQYSHAAAPVRSAVSEVASHVAPHVSHAVSEVASRVAPRVRGRVSSVSRLRRLRGKSTVRKVKGATSPSASRSTSPSASKSTSPSASKSTSSSASRSTSSSASRSTSSSSSRSTSPNASKSTSSSAAGSSDSGLSPVYAGGSLLGAGLLGSALYGSGHAGYAAGKLPRRARKRIKRRR